jgi:acid phosphatase family membrane protein YuiD
VSVPTDNYSASDVRAQVSTAFLGAPISGSIVVDLATPSFGIPSSRDASVSALEAAVAAVKDYLETTYPSTTVTASITYTGEHNSEA